MSYLNNLSKPNCNFVFKYTTVEDVYSLIFSLSNSYCLDAFGLNSKIIKIPADYICEPLTHILTIVWRLVHFLLHLNV